MMGDECGELITGGEEFASLDDMDAECKLVFSLNGLLSASCFHQGPLLRYWSLGCLQESHMPEIMTCSGSWWCFQPSLQH